MKEKRKYNKKTKVETPEIITKPNADDVSRLSGAEVPAVIDNLPANMNVNPQSLIAMAIHQKVDMSILKELLDMRERLQKEQAQMAFRDAMSKFQAECPIIIKTRKVLNKDKTERYRFAPLDVIISKVKNILANNGLSYTFNSRENEKSFTSICHIHHILGHTETTEFTLDIQKSEFMNSAQNMGQTRSYANRYNFCNAIGLLTGEEDNDANIPPSPEDEIKKAEQVAKIAAATAKIAALPENIKEGFKILNYNAKLAFMFCEQFEWNNGKIMIEINKIIDAKSI